MTTVDRVASGFLREIGEVTISKGLVVGLPSCGITGHSVADVHPNTADVVVIGRKERRVVNSELLDFPHVDEGQPRCAASGHLWGREELTVVAEREVDGWLPFWFAFPCVAPVSG